MRCAPTIVIMLIPSGLFGAAGTPVGPPGGRAVRDGPATAEQPPRLYAATYDAGLWRSVDGGLEWERTSCPMQWATAVAACSATSGVVYAAGDRHIYRSLDGGDTWSPGVFMDVLELEELACDPTSSDTVYLAATQYGGTSEGDLAILHKSTDGGETWRQIWLMDSYFENPVTADISRPAFSAVQPGTLFAASGKGVIRSDDDGETFHVLAGSPVQLGAISLEPSLPERIWVAGRDGVAVSSDGGATWHAAAPVPCPNRPSTVLALPVAGRALAAACGQVWGTAGGHSWSPLGAGLPGGGVTSLALKSVHAGRLYAGTASGIYSLALPWAVKAPRRTMRGH